MKLTYRGVKYDYKPLVVETTATEVGGKYRGRDWRFRNLKKQPVIVPTANLTYRGVTYNRPEFTAQEKVAPKATPKVSAQEKARMLMMAHTQTVKNRQQSMLSRSATEIGSTANAADYWNRVEGKINPGFRGTYDRYGAAMS